MDALALTRSKVAHVAIGLGGDCEEIAEATPDGVMIRSFAASLNDQPRSFVTALSVTRDPGKQEAIVAAARSLLGCRYAWSQTGFMIPLCTLVAIQRRRPEELPKLRAAYEAAIEPLRPRPGSQLQELNCSAFVALCLMTAGVLTESMLDTAFDEGSP